jgi:hypothetical protein
MAYIPPPEAASYYTNADLDHVGYLCRQTTTRSPL